MFPPCIMEIVCEYTTSFMELLLEDAFHRRDWVLLEHYHKTLPTHKRYMFGTGNLDKLLKSDSFDYENMRQQLLICQPSWICKKRVIEEGSIDVLRVFASCGHLLATEIEYMIYRLKCDETQLEELYRNKWFSLMGLRNALKLYPWPAAEKWFASKGWRLAKRP